MDETVIHKFHDEITKFVHVKESFSQIYLYLLLLAENFLSSMRLIILSRVILRVQNKAQF